MSSVQEVNDCLQKLIDMKSDDYQDQIFKLIRSQHSFQKCKWLEPAIWNLFNSAVRKAKWIKRHNSDELVKQIDCKKYCEKLSHLMNVFRGKEGEDEDSDPDSVLPSEVSDLSKFGYRVVCLDWDDTNERFEHIYVRTARRIRHTMAKFLDEAIEKGKVKEAQ